MNQHTRSATFPTHSPLAVTSPIFSPLAKALYIGVRVEVDVTAATFYKHIGYMYGISFQVLLDIDRLTKQLVAKPSPHWQHMPMEETDGGQLQLPTLLQLPTP